MCDRHTLYIGDAVIDEYLLNGHLFRRVGGIGNVLSSIKSFSSNDFAILSHPFDRDIEQMLSRTTSGLNLQVLPLRGPAPNIIRYTEHNGRAVSLDDNPKPGILNSCLDIKDLLLARRFDRIVVSDYGLGTLSPEVCEEIVRYTQSHHTELYVDCRNAHFERYHGATVLLPNEVELERFFARQGAAGTRSLGALAGATAATAIVLKKGANGATIWAYDYEVEIPGIPVRVVDDFGAGDILLGTLSRLNSLNRNFNSMVTESVRKTERHLMVMGSGFLISN